MQIFAGASDADTLLSIGKYLPTDYRVQARGPVHRIPIASISLCLRSFPQYYPPIGMEVEAISIRISLETRFFLSVPTIPPDMDFTGASIGGKGLLKRSKAALCFYHPPKFQSGFRNPYGDERREVRVHDGSGSRP